MRVTIKDIAKLANISPATVSMVLNKKGNLKPETVEKVLNAAKLLNYHPNYNARSLITNKSNCIGMVVPEIINPYYSTLVTHINQEAEKHGYTLILNISDNDIEKEKLYIETLISKNVEGIIVIPTKQNNPDLSHLYHLKAMGIPFVFCTCPYYGIEQSCVMDDVGEGEYLLIKHLLGKGLRKIFLLSAKYYLYYAKARIDGYARAFSEFNLSYDSSWIIETDLDYKAGYDTALKIIENKPDAIVAMNDYTALGVLKALYDKNIEIPDQISVAGYDDLLFASALQKPLTTVYHPLDVLGRKTVEALIEKMNGEKEIKNILIPPALKVRATTI